MAAHHDLLLTARLALALSRRGYRVVLRKVVDSPDYWSRSLGASFIMALDCSSGCHVEYVVDPGFKDVFALGVTNQQFSALWRTLPPVFVGMPCQLQPVIRLLCEEADLAFAAAGRPCPPWRTWGATINRWMSDAFVDFTPPPAGASDAEAAAFLKQVCQLSEAPVESLKRAASGGGRSSGGSSSGGGSSGSWGLRASAAALRSPFARGGGAGRGRDVAQPLTQVLGFDAPPPATGTHAALAGAADAPGRLGCGGGDASDRAARPAGDAGAAHADHVHASPPASPQASHRYSSACAASQQWLLAGSWDAAGSACGSCYSEEYGVVYHSAEAAPSGYEQLLASAAQSPHCSARCATAAAAPVAAATAAAATTAAAAFGAGCAAADGRDDSVDGCAASCAARRVAGPSATRPCSLDSCSCTAQAAAAWPPAHLPSDLLALRHQGGGGSTAPVSRSGSSTVAVRSRPGGGSCGGLSRQQSLLTRRLQDLRLSCCRSDGAEPGAQLTSLHDCCSQAARWCRRPQVTSTAQQATRAASQAMVREVPDQLGRQRQLLLLQQQHALMQQQHAARQQQLLQAATQQQLLHSVLQQHHTLQQQQRLQVLHAELQQQLHTTWLQQQQQAHAPGLLPLDVQWALLLQQQQQQQHLPPFLPVHTKPQLVCMV